jgi:hypothetical protein
MDEEDRIITDDLEREEKDIHGSVQPEVVSGEPTVHFNAIENAINAAQTGGGGGKIYGQGKPIPLNYLPAYSQAAPNPNLPFGQFAFVNPFQNMQQPFILNLPFARSNGA